MSRGPICGENLGPGWIDPGTQARTRMPTRNGTLSEEEQNVLLDLGQMTLDLVGIVDPTPISDGTNALISAGRGDWFGAGISAVAMVPLLGDLAKAGKLGRWAQTVDKALALTRRNARFAERARPLLRRLSDLLSQVPTAMLPDATRPLVKRLRQSIDTVIGRTVQLSRRALLEACWKAWSRYIDGITFPKLPPGHGVLWSRLPDGSAHAKILAQVDSTRTLEMQLAPLKFEEGYQLVQKRLIELLGSSEAIQKEIWENFGRKVWEKVARRYTESLSGRVRAHVRFSGDRGLLQVGSHEAIVWDELDQIADAMTLNVRITSVELVDVFTGLTKEMSREQILRAGRQTN